jgi:hypothetical protein
MVKGKPPLWLKESPPASWLIMEGWLKIISTIFDL